MRWVLFSVCHSPSQFPKFDMSSACHEAEKVSKMLNDHIDLLNISPVTTTEQIIIRSLTTLYKHPVKISSWWGKHTSLCNCNPSLIISSRLEGAKTFLTSLPFHEQLVFLFDAKKLFRQPSPWVCLPWFVIVLVIQGMEDKCTRKLRRGFSQQMLSVGCHETAAQQLCSYVSEFWVCIAQKTVRVPGNEQENFVGSSNNQCGKRLLGELRNSILPCVWSTRASSNVLYIYTNLVVQQRSLETPRLLHVNIENSSNPTARGVSHTYIVMLSV